jgi:hypothetical protein
VISHVIAIIMFGAFGTIAIAAITFDVVDNWPAIRRALRRRK